MLAFPASAEETLLEEVSFDDLAEAGRQIEGFDAWATVRAALAGEMPLDWTAIERAFHALVDAVRERCLSLLAALAPIAAASILVRILIGENGRGAKGMRLFCRVACASVLAARFATARELTERFSETLAGLSEVVAPVLASALTLAGGTAAASILSPLSAVCAGLIQRLTGGVGLRLCGIAAAAAIAGGLSDRLRLGRLYALARTIMNAGVAALAAAFMGILWLQGTVCAGRDSVSLRAARLAAENLVPVIGGEMSETMSSLAGSALIVKNAVGVTGLVLLLGACAGPVLSLAAELISMKLASVMLENVGDRGLSEMTARFAGVMEMLLAGAIGSAALALMLTGAGLAALGQGG